MPKKRRQFTTCSQKTSSSNYYKSNDQGITIPLERKSTSVLSVKNPKEVKLTSLRRKDLKSLTYLTNSCNEDNKLIPLKSCLSSQGQSEKIKMKVKFNLNKGDDQSRYATHTSSVHDINENMRNRYITTQQQSAIHNNNIGLHRRGMDGDNECRQIEIKSNIELKQHFENTETNNQINWPLLKTSLASKIKNMIVEKSKQLSDTSIRQRHVRKSIKLKAFNSYSSINYNKFKERLNKNDVRIQIPNSTHTTKNISSPNNSLNEKLEVSPINNILRRSMNCEKFEMAQKTRHIPNHSNFPKNINSNNVKLNKYLANPPKSLSGQCAHCDTETQDVCVTGRKYKLCKNLHKNKKRRVLTIEMRRKIPNDKHFSDRQSAEVTNKTCNTSKANKYFLRSPLKFLAVSKSTRNNHKQEHKVEQVSTCKAFKAPANEYTSTIIEPTTKNIISYRLKGKFENNSSNYKHFQLNKSPISLENATYLEKEQEKEAKELKFNNCSGTSTAKTETIKNYTQKNGKQISGQICSSSNEGLHSNFLINEKQSSFGHNGKSNEGNQKSENVILQKPVAINVTQKTKNNANLEGINNTINSSIIINAWLKVLKELSFPFKRNNNKHFVEHEYKLKTKNLRKKVSDISKQIDSLDQSCTKIHDLLLNKSPKTSLGTDNSINKFGKSAKRKNKSNNRARIHLIDDHQLKKFNNENLNRKTNNKNKTFDDTHSCRRRKNIIFAEFRKSNKTGSNENQTINPKIYKQRHKEITIKEKKLKASKNRKNKLSFNLNKPAKKKKTYFDNQSIPHKTSKLLSNLLMNQKLCSRLPNKVFKHQYPDEFDEEIRNVEVFSINNEAHESHKHQFFYNKWWSKCTEKFRCTYKRSGKHFSKVISLKHKILKGIVAKINILNTNKNNIHHNYSSDTILEQKIPKVIDKMKSIPEQSNAENKEPIVKFKNNRSLSKEENIFQNQNNIIKQINDRLCYSVHGVDLICFGDPINQSNKKTKSTSNHDWVEIKPNLCCGPKKLDPGSVRIIDQKTNSKQNISCKCKKRCPHIVGSFIKPPTTGIPYDHTNEDDQKIIVCKKEDPDQCLSNQQTEDTNIGHINENELKCSCKKPDVECVSNQKDNGTSCKHESKNQSRVCKNPIHESAENLIKLSTNNKISNECKKLDPEREKKVKIYCRSNKQDFECQCFNDQVQEHGSINCMNESKPNKSLGSIKTLHESAERSNSKTESKKKIGDECKNLHPECICLSKEHISNKSNSVLIQNKQKICRFCKKMYPNNGNNQQNKGRSSHQPNENNQITCRFCKKRYPKCVCYINQQNRGRNYSHPNEYKQITCRFCKRGYPNCVCYINQRNRSRNCYHPNENKHIICRFCKRGYLGCVCFLDERNRNSSYYHPNENKQITCRFCGKGYPECLCFVNERNRNRSYYHINENSETPSRFCEKRYPEGFTSELNVSTSYHHPNKNMQNKNRGQLSKFARGFLEPRVKGRSKCYENKISECKLHQQTKAKTPCKSNLSGSIRKQFSACKHFYTQRGGKHLFNKSTCKKKRYALFRRKKKRTLFRNINCITKRVDRFEAKLHKNEKPPFFFVYKMCPKCYPRFMDFTTFVKRASVLGMRFLAYLTWIPWIIALYLLNHLFC